MTKMNQKPKSNKLRDEIRCFVIKWNNDFPIDRWWRNKHNVAFGSQRHKEVDFIQMFLEYEEDIMVSNLSKPSTEETFDFLSHQGKKISKKQIDEDFDNFDISEMDDTETDK